MVGVAQKNKNVLCFLWHKSPMGSNLELQVLRFTRVVFGVASSPFLLNATIKHHLEQYQEKYPLLIRTLLHSIYVDDILMRAQMEEEAYSAFIKST